MILVLQTLAGYTLITALIALAIWLGVKSARLKWTRNRIDHLLYRQQPLTVATMWQLRNVRLIRRPVVTYLTYPGAYLLYNRRTNTTHGATSENILHDIYNATRDMSPDEQHETDVYGITRMAILNSRLTDPVTFLERIAKARKGGSTHAKSSHPKD